MLNARKSTRARLATAGATAALVLLAGGLGAGPASAASEQTLWGSGTPAGADTADDTASVELGTAFKAEDAGTIAGVRYWRSSDASGTQVAALWSSGGSLLAKATTPSSSSTGWQTARFASPVEVSDGASYVVSYHAPQGEYSFTTDYHGSDLASGLSIPGTDAGRYSYSSSTTFPRSSYRSTNYWVTPLFTAAASEEAAPAPVPTSTPTSTPTPTPTPSTSTKPGAGNTGVPAGTSLSTYTGPRTITTDGTVIDSKDISGGLIIRAKDVVIRKSKIHGSGENGGTGVAVEGSGSATITDTEIYSFEVGITYTNFTAIRVNLHDITFDGLKMSSNARLQDSWIHGATPTDDAHWDGVQVQNGVVNTVIQGNTIDARGSSTNSALFLTPDLGPTTDGPLTVTGNWLDGGNFTVNVLDGDNGRYYIRNIAVKNNRFGHGGRYGASYVNVPVAWSGNVWDDTGRTVGY